MPINIDINVTALEALETLKQIEERLKSINIAVEQTAEMMKASARAQAGYLDTQPETEQA
jgi:hypothetical protein